MIASRPELVLACAALALVAACTGCRTAAPADPSRTEEWLARPVAPISPREQGAPRVPSEEDRLAARLAAAALASRRTEVEALLRDLRAREERSRREAGGALFGWDADEEGGLTPLALDLRNAMLDDDVAYRRAAAEQLDHGALDPALETRLDEAVEDDPLELASERIWESRFSALAKLFNAVSEPVASSLLTGGTTSLYSGAISLLRLAARSWGADPLDVRERQALAHWRRYRRLHPDSAEARELEERVARAERKLRETRRNRALRAAERALEAGSFDLAAELAERALREVPDDDEARALWEEARAGAEAEEARERRTLRAALPGHASPSDAGITRAGRELAEALLLPASPPDELERRADALLERRPRGFLADEARYVRALARWERGEESRAWEEIERLARRDPRESNMARHAQALLASPLENAHGHFEEFRGRGRRRTLAWLVLGNFSRGSSLPNVHPVVGYTLDLYGVAQTVATTPLRLLQYPWLDVPDFQRSTAAAARRYVALRPHGEHADEVLGWLREYEGHRGNWVAVWRTLEGRDDVDPVEYVEVREKAAEQARRAAERQTRSDARHALLRQVVREFPRTQAARTAGESVRRQAERHTPQRIRLSRGFLRENPRVSGPLGLGLRPGLLDGDTGNGELHPEGVIFLGGRVLEFAFVARSGDEDDPPVRVQHEFGEAELARLVSLVDETTLRNAQIDPDDSVGADAARDLYFERARLGLTDRPDQRASAESSYAYRGVRERYGLVRGRESILPLDLVVMGSFTDLRLGAYPRLREPKPTPDAFLYR